MQQKSVKIVCVGMRPYLLHIAKVVHQFSLVLVVFICAFSKNQDRSNEPFISGDNFRKISNFILDRHYNKILDQRQSFSFDPTLVKKGDIIYICSLQLDNFFENYYPKIKEKFILITGNADLPIKKEHLIYLDEDKIYACFSMNALEKHLKIIPIPRGLRNKCLPQGKKEFSAFLNTLKLKGIPKKQLLFVCHKNQTYPLERVLCKNKLEKNGFSIENDILSEDLFFKKMLESVFVASPRGRGEDCFRTWQALYLGTYPIIKSSPLNALFKDLPVVIIDNWDEVTESFLLKKQTEFDAQYFNLEKCYYTYWENLILQTKEKLLADL